MIYLGNVKILYGLQSLVRILLASEIDSMLTKSLSAVDAADSNEGSRPDHLSASFLATLR